MNRVLVLGGGLGAAAARRLAAAAPGGGHDVEVPLVNRSNFLTYAHESLICSDIGRRQS